MVDRSSERPPIVGWRLVGWTAVVVGGVVAATLARFGLGEAGARGVLRATAATSFVLFTSAFVASALARLWPTRVTRFLLLNRRYLGVSFAVSHLYHLMAILALVWLPGSSFEPGRVTVIGGSIAYVFIAAMVATSFDRTAAWLGPRWWRRLHTVGVYVLWVVFAPNYIAQAGKSPGYALFAAIALGSLVLRLVAGVRTGSRAARLADRAA